MTTFREYREAVSQGRHPGLDLPSLPTDAVAFQGERAGLVSRAVAAGIDVAIVFVVVLATVAALWMLSFLVNPTNADLASSFQSAASRTDRLPSVFSMVVYGYVFNVLYWTVFWAISGRTIGNLVMGLRVVNRKGRHPGWFVSLVRALLCTAFPLGLLWVLVSGANRSVQDLLLRTSVTYDWVVGIPWLTKDPKRS
jgi:uncharacterized RDD family membrane protein YckC